MAKYKKCPRCEINYILIDEDYCELCKEELAGTVNNYDLDVDEADDAELCPVCHKNFLNPGEKICEDCAKAEEFQRAGGLDRDIEEELDESGDEQDDIETPSVEDEDLDLSLEELQDDEFSDLDDLDEEEQEEIEEADDLDDLKDLMNDDLDEDEDETPVTEDDE